MTHTALKLKNSVLLTFVATGLMAMNGFSQTVELDQVKYVPAIHESHMKTLAVTIWPLYEDAIKVPDLRSSEKALNESVFLYYDTDFENQHEKLYDLKGQAYSCSEKAELLKNDRLLFNLTFNPEGFLVVPDTIYVISHRMEEKESKLYPVNLKAFAVCVNDSAKLQLGKVRLEHIVKSRVRNPDGEHNPVQVLVPFNLARREGKKQLAGNVVTDDEKVDVIPVGYNPGDENAMEILKSMEAQIELKLMQYKQGKFYFVVERVLNTYQIDLNIRRSQTWLSQQTKNFTLSTYRLVQFDGTGEKTKLYQAAQRTMQAKLKPAEPSGK